MPFFRFEMKTGMEPTSEVNNFLESLSYQVHNKLSTKNLRESIFTMLQHLIVVGDVLVIQEDDMTFRIIRSDQYVCRRTVEGDVTEIIHIEYIPVSNEHAVNHHPFTHGYHGEKGRLLY